MKLLFLFFLLSRAITVTFCETIDSYKCLFGSVPSAKEIRAMVCVCVCVYLLSWLKPRKCLSTNRICLNFKLGRYGTLCSIFHRFSRAGGSYPLQIRAKRMQNILLLKDEEFKSKEEWEFSTDILLF